MEAVKRPFFAVARHRIGVDGKGVTTLCTFHGCPLRCKYCLNPQGLRPDTACKLYSPKELYDTVKIDELYFLATGGGVTFGGGEPLLNPDFIKEFRALCGSAWHLTAETSLNVPKDNVRSAAQSLDEFIVDIKDTNPEIYLSYTGRSNERVLSNLKLLLTLTGPDRITVRVPKIPNYNTDKDIAKSKALLAQMGIVNFNCFDYIIR
ncbi:MAG: radical SAM protein [Ruminococcaceae bacterium]|nr:radical SAM protein [Oscillospiraceae bacterium]